MLNALSSSLAIIIERVPDTGYTLVLLTGGILAVGVVARFVQNRKK